MFFTIEIENDSVEFKNKSFIQTPEKQKTYVSSQENVEGRVKKHRKI